MKFTQTELVISLI